MNFSGRLGKAIFAGMISLPITLFAAPLKVGDSAPRFQLESVLEKPYSSKQMFGHVTIYVVAREKVAAPPSKVWMAELLKQIKHPKVDIFQVIVADKPWYMPKSAVRSWVKDFVPKFAWSQILIDWGTRYSDVFGVPLHDYPTIIIVDHKGVIRFWHKGNIESKAFQAVKSKTLELAAPLTPTDTAKQKSTSQPVNNSAS